MDAEPIVGDQNFASPEAEAALAVMVMDPASRTDPYPVYRFLREAAPVLVTSFGPVVLSRYRDCLSAMRDHRLGRMSGSAEAALEPYDLNPEDRAALARGARSLLFLNPPEHTRLRRLIQRAFTPHRIEELRPAIAGRVSDLLAGVDPGEVELISELARPLPVAIISDLLGLPEEDRGALTPLIRATAVTLEMIVPEEALQAAGRAMMELAAYFRPLLEERQRHPGDDLLSALVADPGNGEAAMTVDEVIATAVLIFGAGFETTTNLIGNGTLALARHPDQMERLVEDPSLVDSAVEEMLRYDSPAQIVGRVALEPLEIAGCRIEMHQPVLSLVGGANRDPAVFDRPDEFDVGRPRQSPLSFGSGIHFCLGAALARAEGSEFFRALVSRGWRPKLLADRQPTYRPTLVLRGLEALPLTFSG
jgi:cytochrome P450